MARISMLVSPKGVAKVSVAGVQGSSCLQLTANLESRLGHVGQHELTNEYYEQEQHVDAHVEQEHK